jgi:hypothetical protein
MPWLGFIADTAASQVRPFIGRHRLTLGEGEAVFRQELLFEEAASSVVLEHREARLAFPLGHVLGDTR